MLLFLKCFYRFSLQLLFLPHLLLLLPQCGIHTRASMARRKVLALLFLLLLLACSLLLLAKEDNEEKGRGGSGGSGRSGRRLWAAISICWGRNVQQFGKASYPYHTAAYYAALLWPNQTLGEVGALA